MKKKILIILMICLFCFTGCNSNDNIEIINKSSMTFDDINIKIKPGYFYNNHEKFTVDENTIGVTIYFSTEDDSWG